MKRQTAGRVARPRVCARCKGLISESRPVYLVFDNGGKIVGPYHAGCAERIKMDPLNMYQQGELLPEVFGKVIERTRLEDEPW